MTSLILLAILNGPLIRPYTATDQVTLKRVQGFEVSPDGKWVVYALRVVDLEANKARTDLYLASTDGRGEPRQLTAHPDNDSDPRFSPDGKWVYFLSTRGGSSQVWRIALDGGEAVAVTKAPVDIGGFTLSRDGKQLLFTAEVYAECDLDCTAKRAEAESKKKSTGRLYEQLLYRHWDSWSNGRFNHLFVQPVEAAGPAVDVMKKMKADAPTRPFGGTEEFTFTPDGKGVVFAANDTGREAAWNTDTDLWLASTDGKAAPKKLTEKNRATDTAPAFSPDGKTLAYLAMKRPGFESDRLWIVLRSWPDGKERFLAEAWDRSAGSLAWSSDGKSLLVTADELGQHPLFSIDVASGAATKLVADGNVAGADEKAGVVVVGRDDLKSPVDLWRVPPGGKGDRTRLTAVNQNALSSVKLGDFEQFSFQGANNETVYGYLVKPIDFDAKKKYPLAFLIHGGPQGSFGNHFHYRWNPQTYAGHGYVAVMIDFHGSTGYGQAFTDSISGDWGGKPLEDLQKGLAAALAKYPFIDKERMCALGASYGGYMVNLIAGVWNEPWKCLVSHDGNLDERFAYYATEELWFPEWEHGGAPWEKPEGYAKHNPIDHVAKWKVPMLVVHSSNDFRVVETEGMATFTVLQRRGIPSQFLSFPDENHWVLKPANSIQWHETVLGWLDRWTKKK
jgi:dipeptidyl aminopeptidase/acylaminoacyl peptidase